MLLVLDVGNSNIKNGIFKGDKLLSSWRIAADRSSSSDEYGVNMMRFLDYTGKKATDISGVIIGSVVPELNYTLDRMVKGFFNIEPMLVSTELDLGIEIDYDPPNVLGADRIANAVAAYTEHGGPCITVDFGTATSFGAVDASGTFVGGAIAPGIKTSTDALVTQAAQLHRFEFKKPPSPLAKSTIECMQNGLIYGFTGLADNIIRRMKEELGEAIVIGTGGLSNVLINESSQISVVDRLLTLKGLRYIYERNSQETPIKPGANPA